MFDSNPDCKRQCKGLPCKAQYPSDKNPQQDLSWCRLHVAFPSSLIDINSGVQFDLKRGDGVHLIPAHAHGYTYNLLSPSMARQHATMMQTSTGITSISRFFFADFFLLTIL